MFVDVTAGYCYYTIRMKKPKRFVFILKRGEETMNRKTLAVLLCGAMAVSMLAGCGGSSDSTE
jgi:hypothetical protein